MSRLLTTGVLQQARNLSQQKQYALSFDGVNDYVDCGTGILISDNMTFELRLKKTISKAGGLLYKATDYSSGIFFYFFDWNRPVGMQFGFSTKWANFPLQYGLNEYSSFTIVKDGINGHLYLDGQLIATQQAYNAVSRVDLGTTSTIIGRESIETLRAFGGEISDVRIWSIARTQQQIQDNLNKKLTGTEPGLVAYYDFSEGEGTILHDKTLNGNDGTIYGAQWIEI